MARGCAVFVPLYNGRLCPREVVRGISRSGKVKRSGPVMGGKRAECRRVGTGSFPAQACADIYKNHKGRLTFRESVRPSSNRTADFWPCGTVTHALCSFCPLDWIFSGRFLYHIAVIYPHDSRANSQGTIRVPVQPFIVEEGQYIVVVFKLHFEALVCFSH